MKNNVLLTSLVAVSLFAAQAKAGDDAPWLTIDSQVNFDATGKKSNDYELSLKTDAAFRFEVVLREGIKAVVKARIEEELMKGNDVQDLQKLELDKVLEEAYIQIETDKMGLPRAVVTLGKHEIAFGQAVTQLPMFRDSLLYSLASQREVIGMTVSLPVGFLKIVDELAVSVYENGAGDFKIADERGVSVRLSKQLNEQLRAQVSTLIQENAGASEKETRTSIGFVFTGDDGKYTVWAQGLVFEHSPSMPEDRTYGGQIGASMKLGAGSIVIDYQFLQDNASELALAYNIPVGQYLVISPELRQSWNGDGERKDTTVGVQARINFDKKIGKKLKKG